MCKWLLGCILALALAGCSRSPIPTNTAPGASLTPADKIVFTIDIPLDNKPEKRQFHVVIKYIVHESGMAVSMRDVYDWARQASLVTQLKEEDLQKARTIVHLLPKGTADVAQDRSVIVTEFVANGNERRVFDRAKLPCRMKELFSLFGQDRFGLKDKLQFVAEPGEPAERQNPG